MFLRILLYAQFKPCLNEENVSWFIPCFLISILNFLYSWNHLTSKKRKIINLERWSKLLNAILIYRKYMLNNSNLPSEQFKLLLHSGTQSPRFSLWLCCNCYLQATERLKLMLISIAMYRFTKEPCRVDIFVPKHKSYRLSKLMSLLLA